MWEFKEDAYIGIYFGKLVGKNHWLENEEKKTYRFKDVTCEHEDSFMGLNFMNTPLFEMYDLPYINKSDEKTNWGSKETKKMCIKYRT